MYQQHQYERYNDRRRRRNEGPSTPSFLIISLLTQIYQHLDTLPVKPPATIALLFLNIYPHIAPNVNVAGYYLSDISSNCLYPSKVINSYKWYGTIPINRIILSGFIHADDQHLYYNMLSLLWKGCNLERHMSTLRFVLFIIFSLVISHSMHILLSYILLEYLHFDRSTTGYDSCAVGFSAVLFSMKYVWNQYHCDLATIWGISVQSKYACWLELVIISWVSPNASFIGHLSGILAGILYMYCKYPIDLLADFINAMILNQQRRYTYARGYSTR